MIYTSLGDQPGGFVDHEHALQAKEKRRDEDRYPSAQEREREEQARRRKESRKKRKLASLPSFLPSSLSFLRACMGERTHLVLEQDLERFKLGSSEEGGSHRGGMELRRERGEGGWREGSKMLSFDFFPSWETSSLSTASISKTFDLSFYLPSRLFGCYNNGSNGTAEPRRGGRERRSRRFSPRSTTSPSSSSSSSSLQPPSIHILSHSHLISSRISDQSRHSTSNSASTTARQLIERTISSSLFDG